MVSLVMMTVISVSLSPELSQRVDAFQKARGYSSRSEVVRDGLRELLSSDQLNRFRKGLVTSTVTVISRQTDHEIDMKLASLRHEYNHIVSGDMHIHLGEEYCLEIYITKGEASEVSDFIHKVRTIRTVDQVVYTMVPISGNTNLF
jgi:CopG family nickel-responsive transcriptional regulator